jgi:hypothetical protein
VEKVAYDKDELEKKALAAIKRHKIKFITHVWAYLPCSLSTFYAQGLEKSETLKDAVERNRTSSKVGRLNKWEKSQNATLQVAYYKLIADEDEAHRLNGSKQDIKAEIGIRLIDESE